MSLPAAKARLTVSATRESKQFVIRSFTFREAADTIVFFLRRGADIRMEAVEGVDSRIADAARKKAHRHRETLLLQQKGRCAHCPSGQRLQIHHIHALADGGLSDIENLELVCNDCHVKIHRAAKLAWVSNP